MKIEQYPIIKSISVSSEKKDNKKDKIWITNDSENIEIYKNKRRILYMSIKDFKILINKANITK